MDDDCDADEDGEDLFYVLLVCCGDACDVVDVFVEKI